MTVYARSDVSAVAISPAHGGCGQTHSRPVLNGAPAKLWQLDCAKCEDQLRTDPLWSGLPSKVPETPDEQSAREDSEKRGQLEQSNQVNTALQKMSQLGDLPRVLEEFLRFMTGAKPVEQKQDTVVDGETVEKQVEATPAETAAVDDAPTASEDAVDLEEVDLYKLGKADLVSLAEKAGVDSSGNKADIIARLEEKRDEGSDTEETPGE